MGSLDCCHSSRLFETAEAMDLSGLLFSSLLLSPIVIAVPSVIVNRISHLSLSTGNVLENGVEPRFFRRLAEGVFDIEDLKLRTNELADLVNDASKAYDFDLQRVTAVGYSNGALSRNTIFCYSFSCYGSTCTKDTARSQ